MEKDGPGGSEADPAAEEAGLTRRQVVATGAAAGIGLLAAAVPVTRYLAPVAGVGGDGTAEVPADQLGVWQAERVLVAGRPGFVVRTPDAVHAVSGVCTHLGCVVKWQRSRRIFFCPCHGGRFAPDGTVLGGPPPSPLPQFDVAEQQGKLVVRVA